MGDVIRFPGAKVDYEWLDRFVWTEELLQEYAACAWTLAARFGSNAPTAQLGRWPRRVCQDCDVVARRRFRIGRLLLCERDTESRLRVRRALEEPPLPDVPGSLSEGARAYRDLSALAWSAEELERRQEWQRRRRTR